MKRTISFFLCILLVFSICIPAFADDGVKKYRDYEYYMCVGDSIAAGYALTKDGSELILDQETDDYTTVYDPDYIYQGYDFAAVPTAYHSLVAEALDAELLQCARSGLRAVEFRYFLEGVFNEYDETLYWDNTWFDTDGNGFTLEDLDRINAYVNYPEKVKQADIMSINVGSNDVLSLALNMVVLRMTSNTTDPTLQSIKDFLDNGGSIGQAFIKLIEYAETVGMLADVIKILTETLDKTYDQFVVNFDACMEKIYELNPDITVIGVGVYNPFSHFRLSSDSDLDLTALIQPTINKINNFIKSYEGGKLEYYYADVIGTELFSMSLDERYFFAYMLIKVHPTLAGHRYMAEQILSVIPEADLPFVDVPKGYWCYDDVKYCYNNGLMKGVIATTFEPDSVMTRGMVATVLYRINGSPDVSGLNHHFSDVADGRYCTDAVIWAYNSGVIMGYNDGSFKPDQFISREEFAAMLYRYACAFAGVDPNASWPMLVQYVDAGKVDSFAKPAMRWAVANGIIKGTTLTTLDPDGDCTRAQCAVMLARFDKSL